MHYGISIATQKKQGINLKRQILICLAYTILIAVLIKLNILKFPAEYFK